MLKKSFVLFAIIILAFTAAQAQDEYESVRVSMVTGIELPAGAKRVLPASVPAEISGGLDQIVEAGKGKLVGGEREVLAWTGDGYRTGSAPALMKELQTAMKNEGWIYEAGGSEGGVTFFSILRENPVRRAVLGFFIADTDGLLLAWTEVLAPDSAAAQTETPAALEDEPDAVAPASAMKNGGSLRDLTGKWERKQGGVSSVDANTGRYLGSSGNYEAYEFFPDGRVAYTSLIAVQNYGCRLEAFSQRKGRATVSGAVLNVALSTGTVRRDDSCSRNKNYTKPIEATKMDYKFSVGKDEYGVMQLCLTEPSGDTFCYQRAK